MFIADRNDVLYKYESLLETSFIEQIQQSTYILFRNVKDLLIRKKRRVDRYYNYVAFSNFFRLGYSRGFDINTDYTLEILNSLRIISLFAFNIIRT